VKPTQNFTTGLLLSAITFQVHEPHIFSNKTNIRYNDNVSQIIIAGREGERKERRLASLLSKILSIRVAYASLNAIEGFRTENRKLGGN